MVSQTDTGLVKDLTYLVVGCILALVGAGFAIQSAAVIMHDQRAQGIVIGMVRSGNPPLTKVYYQARVAFRTKAHRLVEFTDSYESRYGPAYVVGDRVSVYYGPTHPQDATINAPTSLWSYAGALGGCGVASIVYALRRQILSRLRRTRLPSR